MILYLGAFVLGMPVHKMPHPLSIHPGTPSLALTSLSELLPGRLTENRACHPVIQLQLSRRSSLCPIHTPLNTCRHAKSTLLLLLPPSKYFFVFLHPLGRCHQCKLEVCSVTRNERSFTTQNSTTRNPVTCSVPGLPPHGGSTLQNNETCMSM